MSGTNVFGSKIFASDNSQLTRVDYRSLGFGRANIKMLSAGEAHLVYLTTNNEIFVSGNSEYGQLGSRHSAISPAPLTAFNEMISQKHLTPAFVSCGAFFTMIVLTDSNFSMEKLWKTAQRGGLTDIDILTQ